MVTAESEQYTTIEGSVLNYRYQIDRILNDKGGMGVIYQATDLNLRGTVVLKKSRFVDEQSRAAFEREARLLYGLRHNALPRVIDYFLTEDQSQFFVMEFIPGKDLSELLSMRIERGEGPFPMDQVLDWYEQLLEALHYLHTHEPPIIHRDIKPQNLKLMPNGQIILLDFGLAKGSVGGMTLGVSIQGYTPNYAPLEQMRGSGTDARSDIYSLAVTMHCLLTGQMPPDAVSRAIETLSAQPDPLRAVRDINPLIPEVISEAIRSSCSLNQNERPQTAAVMREMLRRARAGFLKGTPSQKQIEATPSVAPATAAKPVTRAPVIEKSKSVKSAPSPVTPRPQPAPAPMPAMVTVTPIVNTIGQETQVDEKPAARVAVAEAASAQSSSASNGKAASENGNHFVMAFAPVKTGKHGLVTIPPKNGNGNGNGHSAKELTAEAIVTPAAALAGNVQDTDEMPVVVIEPVIELQAAPPVVEATAPTPAIEVAQTAPEPQAFRPTSIVVIEHFDDSKDAVNGKPNHQANNHHAEVQARPPVQAPTPKVEQRVAMPEIAQVKVPAPPPPAPPPVYRAFDSDSLRRARQAADNLDKPRPIIVNQKKARDEEEQEVKLSNVDPRHGANLLTVAADSGLRSFTEVIGFGVRLEMHAIPGGEFMMGSPEKRGYSDEFPQHKITISPLYIGRYPVTQKQYRAVMRTNPSSHLEDSHPVETVTWDDAVEFCRRLTIATGRIYRLPTEAEWEYACRAGSMTLYNYGDDEDLLNQYGWSLTNAGNHTHPVGEKKPNGWGLCDMHGNVWEWCLDWYDQMYYLQSPNVNPNGPTKGTSRVLRGGSRKSLPNYCRSATRSNHQPDQRDPLVGFRVVCEARELPG